MHIFTICNPTITFQVFVTLITISIVIQAAVTNNRLRRADSSKNAALASAISENQRQALLSNNDFVFDFNQTVPTSKNASGKVVLASVS